MSSTYAGDPTNYPTSITIPSDGDGPGIKAADVNAAFEGLADRTAAVQVQLEPVQDLDALAAIDVSTVSPKTVRLVANTTNNSTLGKLGLYIYDSDAVSLEDRPRVVLPDVGSGAWFRLGGHVLLATAFSTPGVTTWTPPEGVFRVVLRMCGGGGGGGGGGRATASSTGFYAQGGGGGAGANLVTQWVAVDPTTQYDVTVGAGGAGSAGASADATAGTDGVAGGDSILAVTAGPEICRVKGGGGGTGGGQTDQLGWVALGGRPIRTNYAFASTGGRRRLFSDAAYTEDHPLESGEGGPGAPRSIDGTNGTDGGDGGRQLFALGDFAGGAGGTAGANSGGGYKGGGGGGGGGAGPVGAGGAGGNGGAAANNGGSGGAPGTGGTAAAVNNSGAGGGGGGGGGNSDTSGNGGAGGAGQEGFVEILYLYDGGLI